MASNDPTYMVDISCVHPAVISSRSTTANREFEEPWELPGTITRQPIPFPAILLNSKRTMSNWQAARWLLMNRRSASSLAFRVLVDKVGRDGCFNRSRWRKIIYDNFLWLFILYRGKKEKIHCKYRTLNRVCNLMFHIVEEEIVRRKK